jgi:hypothetical protein
MSAWLWLIAGVAIALGAQVAIGTTLYIQTRREARLADFLAEAKE